MILLTDGETNRAAAEHNQVIASLVKAGISVTTIRVGHDSTHVDLLRDIARRTGGQFYHAENAARLPELMLKDTTDTLAQSPQSDKRFAPLIGSNSPALQGIEPNEVPPLHGYAYARPKQEAQVLLHVLTRDRKDPILATWPYGLGRVVAFTADVHDDAEMWIGWASLGKFWSQVVHWAAREHTPQDYALDLRRAGGRIHLSVDAFGDVGDGILMARLLAHPERTIDATLRPIAPRRFSTDLPPVPGGRYPLTLIKRTGDGSVSERTLLVSIPAEDEQPQEEFLADGANLTLLRALTAATGGAVNAAVRDVVGRKPGTRRVERRLDWWLIPLAMGLFLTDVGLRRLDRTAPR
jgi:hypothetical protein